MTSRCGPTWRPRKPRSVWNTTATGRISRWHGVSGRPVHPASHRCEAAVAAATHAGRHRGRCARTATRTTYRVIGPAAVDVAGAAGALGQRVDPVNLAVELDRTVPASGNLTVGGQQFWFGPHLAGETVTLRADTTVVHLMRSGQRLKTVPSRLTPTHLRQLLAGGGRPARPSPLPAGGGAAVEVDRLVNAHGVISLAHHQCPIGYHYAGRRLTIRLDGSTIHLLDWDRTLLRSLPNPLPAGVRPRDARPAGPPPHIPPSRHRCNGESPPAAPSRLPGNASRSAPATPAPPSMSTPPTRPGASSSTMNCYSRSPAPPANPSPDSRPANPNHTDAADPTHESLTVMHPRSRTATASRATKTPPRKQSSNAPRTKSIANSSTPSTRTPREGLAATAFVRRPPRYGYAPSTCCTRRCWPPPSPPASATTSGTTET
jgi:hypothetical protein